MLMFISNNGEKLKLFTECSKFKSQFTRFESFIYFKFTYSIYLDEYQILKQKLDMFFQEKI